MRFSLIVLLMVGLVACGQPEPEPTQERQPSRQRIIQDRFKVYESSLDHGGTVSQLLRALDRRDMIVFAVIDEQASAESVDMDLPPMTLVIFDAPRMSTPLIAAEPLMGAELPFKALVFDKDGQTHIAITGTHFLERLYRLKDQDQILKTLNTTLDAIAEESSRP